MQDKIQGIRRGLSVKLLGLTLAFIMLAEVLVFLPTIGRALQVYGGEVIIELERGALALEVLGPGESSEVKTIGSNFTDQQAAALQIQLLRDTGWQAFMARMPGGREIAAGVPLEARTIDVRVTNPVAFIGQALRIMTDFGEPKMLRLSGVTRDRMSEVDIWVLDTVVRQQLRAYAGRILLISLVISVFAGSLVYLSLRRMIVQPIEQLRHSLAAFAASPQDMSSRIQPSDRGDEIGYIEAETRSMQDAVSATLQQKERLAALGAAVAQVNHDLRGMLSTALLLSDSLESSKDPRVAKAAPVLASSIERAVDLCGATLKFVKGTDVAVEAISADLHDSLFPLVSDWKARWPKIKITDLVPRGKTTLHDTAALHRILDNLARNAVESGSPTLALKAEVSDSAATIRVMDTGPGLSPKAELDLFVPFKGSTKRDGNGLGVAHALDLAEAMGGSLELEKTSPEGTIFAVTLARPVVSHDSHS